MLIEISPTAKAWFMDEMGAKKGDFIRFFGKYGGSTNVHVGFSTGVSFSSPVNPAAKVEVDGVTYFTEESDDWYFKRYNLFVDYDEKKDEPIYRYEER